MLLETIKIILYWQKKILILFSLLAPAKTISQYKVLYFIFIYIFSGVIHFEKWIYTIKIFQKSWHF